jgi:hypothetical protein
MHKGLLIFYLFFMGISQVDFNKSSHPTEDFFASFQTSVQKTAPPEENIPLGTQGELEEDSSDEDGIPADFYPSQEYLPAIIIYQILKPIARPLFQPDAFTPPPRLV